MGATVIGRDLGPRVSSALTSGLTADCTSLEIGEHEDKKKQVWYMKTCYIRSVPHSVVISWQPSSTSRTSPANGNRSRRRNEERDS